MAAPEVLESDLPNAVALLKNLQEQVIAVTAQVQALTKKVQAKAFPTEKGLSLLEVKDQLLLMYLMDLSHLILHKASGGSLQGHAAVLRLVEIRTVLEKLRPLDQKLKYQIDKLVKTAVTGSLSENDPLRFKPHPSNMMSKLNSEDEEEDEAEEGQSGASGKKSGKAIAKKYVPPRLVPVHYDETEAEREKKRLERAKRRALSSSVIRELKEQYSDAPEEIRDARHPHVTRQSQEDQHRSEFLQLDIVLWEFPGVWWLGFGAFTAAAQVQSLVWVLRFCFKLLEAATRKSRLHFLKERNCFVCCGGCRRGTDSVLLWLWRRPEAIAPIRPLAWERP
uniref:Neuroguidin n=1 Tax=Sus scrofa TaxID=9823 RepID=A0A8D0J2X9_PIG